MDLRQLQSRIAEIPDFPKPGILFKDITPLFNDFDCFQHLIEALAPMIPEGCNKIVAIESRGFLIGSPLAFRLKLPLVIARKPGKLPRPTLKKTYQLEYGQDALEIQKEDLSSYDKVCILDDVLATGGTAQTTELLCRELGAEVLSHLFLLQVPGLGGEAKLSSPYRVLFQE